MLIGIISDTHGTLHPRVAGTFKEVGHILHAGDIGGDHILPALRTIAPVTAVPGNIDGVDDAIEEVEIEGIRILLTHILPRPSQPGRDVAWSIRREKPHLVVFGHSHLPHDEVLDGVHFFNPASAGPRRFNYPTSVGLLSIKDGAWQLRHVALDERSESALTETMNQLR